MTDAILNRPARPHLIRPTKAIGGGQALVLCDPDGYLIAGHTMSELSSDTGSMTRFRCDLIVDGISLILDTKEARDRLADQRVKQAAENDLQAALRAYAALSDANKLRFIRANS